MKGKITLITPPDVFENETYSVMFVHLGDKDQEMVSEWFANSSVNTNINIYFYSGETDMAWFFHALARCEYTFIDLDSMNNITSALSGYMIGKHNVSYQTKDENIAAIYQHINQNRITNIQSFLERAFNDQNESNPPV